MANRPQAWRRWVEMSLSYRIRDLCRMARAHGLEIIQGFRPGLCAWESLAFWGSRAQIAALEAEWQAQGIRFFSRMPKGAWPVAVDLPRERWAERTVNWEEEAPR